MSKVTVLMPKRRLTTLWRSFLTRDALGPNAHNKPGNIPWRGLQENYHKYSSRKFFHDLRSQQNKIEMLERIISVKDDEIKKYKEMIINLKIVKGS
ncbi:7113_t:CDS:2 [Rhizophagus irregularis]|nr:7113_t:CDS:2 [Rhizophagus irregularis]